MTFEEKMNRIEEISNLMEENKLSLDESIKIYEEGMLLSKECIDYIEITKGKITEIKKNVDGKIEEQDL